MSDNYIDNSTSYLYDVVDSSVSLPEGDIVNSSLDSLVVGLDGVTADMLSNWIGMSGRTADRRPGGAASVNPNGRTLLSNLSRQQLADILATARRSSGASQRGVRHVNTGADNHQSLTTPVSSRSSEPYEFVLEPITGANPLGIKQRMVFPLPPERFMVSREQQARTFIAINGQEYSLPGPQTLASIALEGMFPAWAGEQKPNFLPGYVTKRNYLKPKDLALVFERLMKKGQPLQLTIGPAVGATPLKTSGGLVGVMYVTIVSFEYGEAFGHPGDYVFTMGLKEWRPIFPNAAIARIPQPATPLTRSPAAATNQPQAITTPTTGGGIGTVAPGTAAPVAADPAPPLKGQSPVTRPDVKTYIVKQGDTLFDIAANVLGSGTRMNELYALNKKTIDDECKRRGSSTYPRGWHIWPGTRLVIPPKGQRDGTS